MSRTELLKPALERAWQEGADYIQTMGSDLSHSLWLITEAMNRYELYNVWTKAASWRAKRATKAAYAKNCSSD